MSNSNNFKRSFQIDIVFVLQVIISVALILFCVSSALVSSKTISRVLALNSDPAQGKRIAASCVHCHNNNTGDNIRLTTLTGLSKKSIVIDLVEFRDGKRSNRVMADVALALSDEDIAAVAGYLATAQTD